MPDGVASRVKNRETWKVPAGNSVMNAGTSVAAAGAASTSPPVSRMSTVTVQLLIAASLIPKGRIDIDRTYSVGRITTRDDGQRSSLDESAGRSTLCHRVCGV